MSKIIGIAHTKGGCGKTTLAICLARGIQLAGNSVVIMDADIEGTASKWASLAKKSGADPPMFDVYRLNHKLIQVSLLKASQGYAFVVVDGMAKMDASVLAPIIDAADLVLVPVKPGSGDLYNVRPILKALTARAATTGGKPISLYVVMGYTKGTKRSHIIDSELRQFGLIEGYAIGVLEGRTSHLDAYPEIFDTGMSVLESTTPSGRNAAGEISHLTAEVLGLL